jgi:hypothetical protein
MPTTADALGDELGVHEADVRYWISTLLDLHDDEIPDVVAAEVRDALNPGGVRTAGPPTVVALTHAYRALGDGPDGAALLAELRTHGHRLVAHALLLERILPPAARRPYSEALDVWLAGGPQPWVLAPG